MTFDFLLIKSQVPYTMTLATKSLYKMKKFSSVLYKLTGNDLLDCVEIWHENKSSVLHLLSPYKWPRLFHDSMPTVMHELRQLGRSQPDVLGEPELSRLGDIIKNRYTRHSHSSINFTSHSSQILRTLIRNPHLKKQLGYNQRATSYSCEFDPTIFKDVSDQINKHEKYLTSHELNKARQYITQMKTLYDYRIEASKVLARGDSKYFGPNNLMFYLYGFKTCERLDAEERIKQFLLSFQNMVQIATEHGEIICFLQKMGCSFLPCLVGKTQGIEQMIDELKRENDISSMTEDALFEEACSKFFSKHDTFTIEEGTNTIGPALEDAGMTRDKVREKLKQIYGPD